MSNGLPLPVADPIFSFVDLRKDPGYEYKGQDGKIYGPFPAVAYYTWAMKGLLAFTTLMRHPDRSEFHAFESFMDEIWSLARVQSTIVLLEGKEWFYFSPQNRLQGPYRAQEMLKFIETLFITEHVKFWSRPAGSKENPPPMNSPLFRCYGDLLSETFENLRAELIEWRRKQFGNQKPSSEVPSAASASVEKETNQTYPSSETIPSKIEKQTEMESDSEFERQKHEFISVLTQKYQDIQIYILGEDNEIRGPYKIGPILTSLKPTTCVALAAANASIPPKNKFHDMGTIMHMLKRPQLRAQRH